MTRDVAIIGSGPTGIYALAALLSADDPPAVTVVEAQAEADWGSPYAPGLNDAALLANIASIEIPPVTETLVAWLGRQDDEDLDRLGVRRAEVDERTFFPRLVLGAYFRAQLDRLVAGAAARGAAVEVLAGHRVADIVPEGRGARLDVEAPDGPCAYAFDHVVIATGHAWPEEASAPLMFPSPYPSSALRAIPACHVGIRGTSLSGIDALVTVAGVHGAFLLDAAGVLQYAAAPAATGFRATLMSRKGLLPEADFFCPIPYEPNAVLTDAAVDALAAAGPAGLLDAVFDLFARELVLADPDYAASVGLAALDADTFAAAYFAPREGRDPFVWAALNLEEARTNYAREATVAWRYAILRAHGTVARAVPHLSPEDRKRFETGLKPVFVDDYATVPHASIDRLLALRRAGRLDVLRLGPDHEVAPARPTGATVAWDGNTARFPAFVEATGQRALSLSDLPFPSLLALGAVHRARAPGRLPWGDGAPAAHRGIDLDDDLRAVPEAGPVREVYCLGLPFLLHRTPFAQGITSAHEVAGVAGRAVLRRRGGALAA